MILTGIHSEKFSKLKYGEDLEKNTKLSDTNPSKTSLNNEKSQEEIMKSVTNEIKPQFLSPAALTLEARILNNDFGIPPVDFHRPSLDQQFSSFFEDTHINISNNALKDFNEIPSEDKGIDAALKVRKGGRMQSRSRTADLKSATCKCTKRRHHPHYFQPHQHCNDTSINNNVYYDKLPAYCTVLSRPPLGIMRNVRILPSELELQENSDKSLMFNKIPAYQSCFSNSTKYDKSSHYDPHDTDNNTQQHDNIKYCNCDKKKINEQINRGTNYGPRFRNRARGYFRSSNINHNSTYNNNENNTYNNNNVHKNNKSDNDNDNNNNDTKNNNNINNDNTEIASNKYDTTNTPPNTCNDCGGCIKDETPSSLTSNNKNIWSSSHDAADDNSKQRRTLYMGRIPRGLSSNQLRKLFERFGRIAHCSVHFREMGDNYGFVTYARHEDAVNAIEKSREMGECRGWDVCFGGRRRFCEADYIDLDGSHQVREEYEVGSKSGPSFNELLSQAFRHRN